MVDSTPFILLSQWGWGATRLREIPTTLHRFAGIVLLIFMYTEAFYQLFAFETANGNFLPKSCSQFQITLKMFFLSFFWSQKRQLHG
jgi:succinate dehydrogenase/fumarate reductase cytochrome b subunit